jgi:hypothetical protein
MGKMPPTVPKTEHGHFVQLVMADSIPSTRATLCGLASGRWSWQRGRTSIGVVSELLVG